jgi:hypothetical protein
MVYSGRRFLLSSDPAWRDHLAETRDARHKNVRVHLSVLNYYFIFYNTSGCPGCGRSSKATMLDLASPFSPHNYLSSGCHETVHNVAHPRNVRCESHLRALVLHRDSCIIRSGIKAPSAESWQKIRLRRIRRSENSQQQARDPDEHNPSRRAGNPPCGDRSVSAG